MQKTMGGAKKVEEEEEHNGGLPPLLRAIHGRGRVRGGEKKARTSRCCVGEKKSSIKPRTIV